MRYTLTISDMTSDEYKDLNSKLISTESKTVVLSKDEPASVQEDDDEKLPGFVTASKEEEAEETEDITKPDADGVMWDKRIHATTKTKTVKGVWKRRKGVSDEEFDRVLAEQKGVVKTAEIPQPAETPAAPDAGAAPTERNFQNFMNHIQSLFASGDITPEYPPTIVARINNAFKDHGITVSSIMDISGNPQLVEYAWGCLEIDGKVAK